MQSVPLGRCDGDRLLLRFQGKRQVEVWAWWSSLVGRGAMDVRASGCVLWGGQCVSGDELLAKVLDGIGQDAAARASVMGGNNNAFV